MIGQTGANKECDPQVNGIYGCLDDGRGAQPRTREDKEGTRKSLDKRIRLRNTLASEVLSTKMSNVFLYLCEF